MKPRFSPSKTGTTVVVTGLATPVWTGTTNSYSSPRMMSSGLTIPFESVSVSRLSVGFFKFRTIILMPPIPAKPRAAAAAPEPATPNSTVAVAPDLRNRKYGRLPPLCAFTSRRLSVSRSARRPENSIASSWLSVTAAAAAPPTFTVESETYHSSLVPSIRTQVPQK